jgi:hypothetical protein
MSRTIEAKPVRSSSGQLPSIRVAREDFRVVDDIGRDWVTTKQSAFGFLVELWKAATPEQRQEAVRSVARRRVASA